MSSEMGTNLARLARGILAFFLGLRAFMPSR